MKLNAVKYKLLTIFLIFASSGCIAADPLKHFQGKWKATHREINGVAVKESLPGTNYDFFPIHGVAIQGARVWVATYNRDFEPVTSNMTSPCVYKLKGVVFIQILDKSQPDPLAAYRSEAASYALDVCKDSPVISITSSKGTESIRFKRRPTFKG